MFRMLVPDSHLDVLLPSIPPVHNRKEDISWLLDIFEEILFEEYPRKLDPSWYKVKYPSRKEHQQKRAQSKQIDDLKLIDRLDFIRDCFYSSIIYDETFLHFILHKDLKKNEKLNIKVKKWMYRSLCRRILDYKITDVFLLYKTKGNTPQEDKEMKKAITLYFKSLKFHLLLLFSKQLLKQYKMI